MRKLIRILFIFLLSLVTFGGYGQCQWDRFKKATDDTTPQGKALTEAIDADPSIIDNWEKLDLAGIRDIEVGYGKAADKQKWLNDLKDGIYRNGTKAEYANPSGNVLKWTDQHPSSIKQSIESALNSADDGKKIEGKVGDFVKNKQGKDVEGFGLKIDNSTIKKPAGDLDLSTKHELIEVKKSYSAFKKEQMPKFVDPSEANFLNPHGKNVILYVDEPLTAAQKADIVSKIPNNVTLVNSLEDLGKILK